MLPGGSQLRGSQADSSSYLTAAGSSGGGSGGGGGGSQLLRSSGLASRRPATRGVDSAQAGRSAAGKDMRAGAVAQPDASAPSSSAGGQADGADLQVPPAVGSQRPWPRVRLREQPVSLAGWAPLQPRRARHRRRRFTLPRLASPDMPTRKLFRRTVSQTSELMTPATHGSAAPGTAAAGQHARLPSEPGPPQPASAWPVRVSFTVYCPEQDAMRYVQYSVDAGRTWRYVPTMPVLLHGLDGEPQRLLVATLRLALKRQQHQQQQSAALPRDSGTVCVDARACSGHALSAPRVWVRMHPGPSRSGMGAEQPASGGRAAGAGAGAGAGEEGAAA